MAFLPDGYADDIAKAEVIVRGDRARDGEYVFLHKKCSYEKTKNGPALIIEHEVIEAKKTDPNIEPNSVGSMVSYFMPDYGDAAVMLKPNMKAYVCGLIGLDPKKTDAKKLAETIAMVGGPQQLARGMLIRGKTFHTEKRSNGEDFMGFNWSPVPGENHPQAASVLKRRAELDAKIAAEAASTPAQAPQNTMPSVGTQPPPQGPGVPPGMMAPSIPGAPALPGQASTVDYLALAVQQGWQPHPQDPNNYYWRGSELKSKADILAGKL